MKKEQHSKREVTCLPYMSSSISEPQKVPTCHQVGPCVHSVPHWAWACVGSFKKLLRWVLVWEKNKHQRRKWGKLIFVFLTYFCFRRYINPLKTSTKLETESWEVPPPKSILLLSRNVKTGLCSSVTLCMDYRWAFVVVLIMCKDFRNPYSL